MTEQTITAIHLKPLMLLYWLGSAGMKELATPMYWHFRWEKYWGVNNLFSNNSIDVIFLNGNKEIVDLKENFKPWALDYTPKKKCSFVLEMPAKSIVGLGLELGQTIDLVDKN